MVANKKTIQQIHTDLELFLGDDTEEFVDWWVSKVMTSLHMGWSQYSTLQISCLSSLNMPQLLFLSSLALFKPWLMSYRVLHPVCVCHPYSLPSTPLPLDFSFSPFTRLQQVLTHPELLSERQQHVKAAPPTPVATKGTCQSSCVYTSLCSLGVGGWCPT